MEFKTYWQSNDPYKLPQTNLTVIGYSVAAERTGFYIPELDIMLDCGLPTNFTPEYVFVTHCHGDHSWELHRILLEINNEKTLSTKKVKIYIPQKSVQLAVNYIHSATIFSKANPNHKRIHTKYEMTGVLANQLLELPIKNHRWLVEIIHCDHQVQTVGYGFSEIRKKLKQEYEGYSSIEIGALKKSGVDISIDTLFPMFCYLGDTTVAVFNDPSIWKYPNIFVECTYIADENDELITKNKHMHWKQLDPIIDQHPNNNFILYHFSKRYKNNEIMDFFKDKLRPNMKLWVSNL